MQLRSRLVPAVLAVALLAALPASAASINDLRQMGYVLIPADALTIDVSGGGAIVLKADAATRDQVFSLAAQLVAQGRSGGDGFISADSAANPYVRLVAALNGRDGVPLFSTFAGEAVDENTVFVTHAWGGDIDLDGRVTADDYFRIDSDFLDGRAARGGDLNADGHVNADDYFLIDASFIGQTGPKAPSAARVFAQNAVAIPLPPAIWGGLALLAAMTITRFRRAH